MLKHEQSASPAFNSSATPDSADAPRPVKRRKFHHIRSNQPSTRGGPSVLPEELVSQMLSRSISTALIEAGFDGADPVALEAFRSATDEFIAGILSSVQRSMLSCRRTQAIPQDLEYALNVCGLVPFSLRPYLKTQIDPSISHPQLAPPPPEPASDPSLSPVLGPDLSGAVAKNRQTYVPGFFPAFPHQHTYKETPQFTEREKDPRKIRERATEEGRLGEEALRRLVGAGKDRSREDMLAKKGIVKDKDPRRRRQELFAKTMAAFASGDFGLDGEGGGVSVNGAGATKDDIDLGGVVNYERMYWRSGAMSEGPRLRKSAAVVSGQDALMEDV